MTSLIHEKEVKPHQYSGESRRCTQVDVLLWRHALPVASSHLEAGDHVVVGRLHTFASPRGAGGIVQEGCGLNGRLAFDPDWLKLVGDGDEVVEEQPALRPGLRVDSLGVRHENDPISKVKVGRNRGFEGGQSVRVCKDALGGAVDYLMPKLGGGVGGVGKCEREPGSELYSSGVRGSRDSGNEIMEIRCGGGKYSPQRGARADTESSSGIRS